MFKGLSKLVKKAAPIAIGAYAPGFGASMGLSPFMSGALASGLGAALMGAKPKDAILSGIMGGAAGSAFAPPAGTAAGTSNLANLNQSMMEQAAGIATPSAPPVSLTAPVFKGKPETFSATLLEGLGLAGKEDPNLLFKLLNTKMGEGLAAGLAAQAFSSLTDDEKEEIQRRRAFGEGYGGGQLGGIQYMNQGGEAYFPRRNGGIDPSEGSGTKDDVPALLLAGEFVHTRDSNEGLGKLMGAKNKDEAARVGIQAQYQLMDAFERMA